MTPRPPIRDAAATATIHLRVTPDDKATLIELANARGKSLTRYLIDGALAHGHLLRPTKHC